jgi:Ca-activated chloride channel family protein
VEVRVIGFIWDSLLLSLVVIPALVWWYARSVARRGGGGFALHSDSEFLGVVRQRRFARRRDLPALLFVVALALSVVALARPTAPLPTLDNRTTIMLAMDVSGSMRNDDIKPSRFVAMQESARKFVRQLPQDINLGLVSFAGEAAVNVPPGTDRQPIFDSIDAMYMARGTAIGAGIRESLGALPGRTNDPDATKPVDQNPPPAIVVLLTDGRNNREPDPLEMAQLARGQEVKVFTIGLGTQDPSQENNPWAGFDPDTLKSIAQTTGGQYFEARSADQLGAIYNSLGRNLGWTLRPGEVTHVVAAIAGVLLLISMVFGETHRRVI